jgi:hypothetical protein
MSPFSIEAAAVGAKEALKLVFVWFAFSAYLSGKERPGLIRFFYAGVAIAALLALGSFLLDPSIPVKGAVAGLVNYVFFVFYMLAMAALFGCFGPGGSSRPGPEWHAGLISVVLTVLYFSPDITGTSLLVRDMSVMREQRLAVYVPALLGFLACLGISGLLLRGMRVQASRFFGTGQFLIFLLLIKMLGGGIKGFGELSLLPSVQRGAMKFIHDFIHQTFVFLMVPDHPLLRLTVWNFIGTLFGSGMGIAVALAVLLLPSLVFLYLGFTAPVEVPEGLDSGAQRRMHRSSVRSDRRMKSLPVAVFVMVILVSWAFGTGDRASTLYNPPPVPLVVEGGAVVIPLSDPSADLMDGSLHKFSLSLNGENVGILVIKKPDGRLAVCLDACEICPPDGYGLEGDNVVCIFCMTPIPLDTLGRTGGCNPIPVEAEVNDREIRISAEEIARKWRSVVTGQTREGIGK